MKIFVAIPGRGHNLDFNVTACLMEEHELAVQCGIKLQFDLYPSSGGIADGRSFLAADFLKSDCDKIFYLDSDITFEKGALLKVATKPVDFVGGAYRFKQAEESYPISFKPGEMWADSNGLIEVDKLPFGFVCLTRDVFKKFDEKFPERLDHNFGGKSTAYFHLPIEDGLLWGEDYQFCKEWKSMGGKIFLDPEIDLTHWNFVPVPYKGNIGKWLKSQPHNIAKRLSLLKEIENGKAQKESTGNIGELVGGEPIIPPTVKDIDLSGLRLS